MAFIEVEHLNGPRGNTMVNVDHITVFTARSQGGTDIFLSGEDNGKPDYIAVHNSYEEVKSMVNSLK